MTKKVRIPKPGPKPKLDTIFRCRVCGKKSEKVIRMQNLPFSICPKCGNVILPPDVIEATVGKNDAPRIITPQQAGMIVPGSK